MKLETLTIKEFTNWAIKNDEITFHQTKEWADLKKRNGWKAQGIAPGYGRDDLESYFNQYKPKTNGFQLIVVNAVFYTEILEKGASHLTRKFMVITQEMANMENVAKQFKGANISLL